MWVFTFPNPVDEHAARTVASGVFVMCVVALALRQPWVLIVLAYGFWAPVGSGVVPGTEVDFLRTYLFGDDDGRAMADRIDRRVDRLPGLQGLNLLRGAVAA